jgi:MFS transporter, DHA1 family, tetracycline resistance protein
MRRASLGTIFLTVFLDLLGFGLVIPFLPGFARSLGAGDMVAALTGAVYSLMQFVLVPVWGRLSDRIGRRPVLLGSIAATAAGMALLGVADTLVLLFAARVFTGAATANIAVAQAYIADVTAPEDRARGMGMVGMAFGLGFILGPFIGGVLADVPLFDRPGAFPAFVAAGLSVVNLGLAAVLLPESLPPELRGAAAARPRASRLGGLRGALGHPELGRAFSINFLLVFWFAGMEQTFRLFTDDAFKMTVGETGRFLGLVGIAAIIVQGGLIGRLTRRFGEVRLLVTGLLIQTVGFATLGASPRFVAPRAALAVACVLIAGGSGLITPSVSSYVSRRAGPTTQGTMLGTLQSLSALARVVGPAVGGLLYQAIAPAAPYYAGAVGMVVAALLAIGLPPPPARPVAR